MQTLVSIYMVVDLPISIHHCFVKDAILDRKCRRAALAEPVRHHRCSTTNTVVNPPKSPPLLRHRRPSISTAPPPPAYSLPPYPPLPSHHHLSSPHLSLSLPNPTLHTDILSASYQFGFFHLTNHSIPSQLVRSAESESESLSLFKLPKEQKQLYFPKNWPLGFDCDDVLLDENENRMIDSFCFDSAGSNESTQLSLASIREFTREMEKVGKEVLEPLSCAVGFDNPVRQDPDRVCSLMWISAGSPGNILVSSGRFYPYVVGLEYQIRCQKYSLLADSGWVSDSPRVDSILVTLGDIAQVWSNGKTKKVRGRPIPSFGDVNNNTTCISRPFL